MAVLRHRKSRHADASREIRKGSKNCHVSPKEISAARMSKTEGMSVKVRPEPPSSPRVVPDCCPICAEDFPGPSRCSSDTISFPNSILSPLFRLVAAFFGSLWGNSADPRATNGSCVEPVETACCHQWVCNGCQYRHLRSIWTEGSTNSGRSALNCPLGCGAKIQDSAVRQCLHQHHRRTIRDIVGSICFVVIRYMRDINSANSESIPSNDSGMTHSSRFYNLWWWNCHTEAERADLQRYLQWSLVVGMRELNNSSHFFVQHCPTPDCNYAWLTHLPYRQSKQRHETESYQWWYSPPRPENVPDDWSRAEYLSLDNVTGPASEVSEDGHRDGRHTVCAKCRSEFCSLCLRPWKFGRHRHMAQSCRSYGSKFPGVRGQDSEFWMVSQQQQAKSCPRCTIRVSRISGCNHMTCPCGFHWCYVCMSRWSTSHYGCVEGQANTASSSCTIQ